MLITRFKALSPLLSQVKPAYFSRTPFNTDMRTSSMPTAGQEVTRNMGLSRFLTKVYKTAGLSVGGILLSSQVFLEVITHSAMPGFALGGMILGIGGLLSASFMKAEPIVQQIQIDGKRAEVHSTYNSYIRRGLYGLGIIGLGASAAPILGAIAAVNPTVIPMAFGLSTAIFGGASLAAFSMPKDKMLGFGRPLMGSLIGLIALQLCGFLATLAVGPNPFSMMVMRADAYLAVGLFTALVAYDTHVAIASYEGGYADHLGVSIQFVLDFWNIFMSLLRIFSRD